MISNAIWVPFSKKYSVPEIFDIIFTVGHVVMLSMVTNSLALLYDHALKGEHMGGRSSQNHFEKFEKLTGYEAKKYINMKNFNSLKRNNLLFEKEGMIFLKEKGMLLINSILSTMLEKS